MCRGNDEFGQASPPQEETFVTISSGTQHTCAVRGDGSVACWGNNDYGQGLMNDLSVPEIHAAAGEGPFTAISANGGYACGLRENGTATCWGDAPDGELAQPPPNARFTLVSVGYEHGCGLRPNGASHCWGKGFELDTLFDAFAGLLALDEWRKFTAVSSGAYHTCGLQEGGTAFCWGSLSQERDSGQATPPGDETLLAINSGGFHTCALRLDGSPLCWGSD